MVMTKSIVVGFVLVGVIFFRWDGKLDMLTNNICLHFVTWSKPYQNNEWLLSCVNR